MRKVRCFFLSLPQTGIPPSDNSTSTADQREKSPSRNERTHKAIPLSGAFHAQGHNVQLLIGEAAQRHAHPQQEQAHRGPGNRERSPHSFLPTREKRKDYSSRFGLYIQKVRAMRCRTEKAKAPRPNRDRKSPLRHKAALGMERRSAPAFRSSPAGTRRRD